MKTAILAAQHQPLMIDDVELPQELSLGQVLVKVCYSSLCGSQIGEILGVKGKDPYLPHLLGHEGSGIIEKVGPGVKTVAVADHVVLQAKDGNGLKSEVPRYRWRGGGLNAGWVTTFNEYAVVSERRLTPIPQDFDMKIAPLLGCAILTGFGAIENTAQPKMGESVVVFGAGGVGLSVVQAAALVSAHPIIAVDLSDSKLELAARFGATLGINSMEQSPKKAILEALGAEGADHVIVCTENLEVLEEAYEVTKTRGRTIFLGLPPIKGSVSLSAMPLHYGRVVTGSLIGESQLSEAIPRYIRLIDAGKLQPKEMITEVFELDEINQAIDKMRQGQINGRCLIQVNP